MKQLVLMEHALKPNCFVMVIQIVLMGAMKDGVIQSMIQTQPRYVIWGED